VRIFAVVFAKIYIKYHKCKFFAKYLFNNFLTMSKEPFDLTTIERQEILKRIYHELSLSGIVRTKEDFALKMNRNYSAISAALNGSERYLTDGLFRTLIQCFPMINPDYIKTGKGEPMLMNGEQLRMSASAKEMKLQKRINELEKTIEDLKKQLSQSQERIDNLISIVGSMAGKTS